MAKAGSGVALIIAIFILVLMVLYAIRVEGRGYLAKWGAMDQIILSERGELEGGDYNLPKILWSFWNTEVVPPFVKSILDQRAAVLSDWEVRVLNDSTIKNYLDELPPNYSTMRQSHKSDWLRLALLSRYGGCWLDATIIVNSAEAFNAVYNQSVTEHSEFTGFYTPLGLMEGDRTSFIESWFIMAPEKSRVIRAWFEEFDKACRIGFDTYRVVAMKGQRFSPHIYGDGGDTYLTVYACAQVAIQKRLRRRVNIILNNSYHTMYKLHYDCWDFGTRDYDSFCIVRKIENERVYVKSLPFIKLTHAQHTLLNK